MSRKNTLCHIIFFVALACLSSVPGRIPAQDSSVLLQSAEEAFAQNRFVEAFESYQKLYESGSYTEQMLYRMAYIMEETKSYPMAIYYLKKAALEFGNKGVDGKVKQVMQLQGSDRFFPSSAWNVYFKFFRDWGWLIWTLFATSILVVLVDVIWDRNRGASWRRAGVAGAWTIAILLSVALAHRSFAVPKLAVLIDQTGFYDHPGYAGKQIPKAFSLGETFQIHDEIDVWSQVQAGDKVFWVPTRCIKPL
jgi:hypothetical protein